MLNKQKNPFWGKKNYAAVKPYERRNSFHLIDSVKKDEVLNENDFHCKVLDRKENEMDIRCKTPEN